ncbi:MAG: ATP-binding region ATPase domain protein [Gemmatimonadetes bacterium]|nr:ATP-binding region ATPase domain protein [Gemmatimonadota bacterium]
MTGTNDRTPRDPTSNGDSDWDSGALLRLLVDSVRDYAIFALDPQGHVLTWNAGASLLKGYEASEIIGRHFSTFYPASEIALAKPEIELREAAKHGRFEDEGWRVRKDGTQFWANVIVTALRDEDGKLVAFAKITRDLSDRRLAEEQSRRLAAESAARAVAEQRNDELDVLNHQLQEQALELEAQTEEAQSLAEELEQTNEQLQETLVQAEQSRAAAELAEQFSRGILESIADPFVVQDSEWRFQYINARAAEIFAGSGHDGRSMIGQQVWQAYPEIVGTPFEREMRRAATERVPVSFEAYYPARSEWSAMYCYPLPDGGLATQWRDITERKRAEESAHYLARASEVLGASLDYEQTLAELATIVVPKLADWCTVDVVGEDGPPRQLAVAHVDPDKVRWAHLLAERYPPNLRSESGSANVIRTGKPELFSEIPDELLAAGAVDAEHLRIMRELGLKSAMVVPLIAHERVLGALTLIAAESGRRYTEADLALAMELARRAAMAVDNARLHRAELQTRMAAERANRAKSEFLAVMSHELRTPLNAIAGHAQILELGLHGPITTGQQQALERIGRAQRHLLGLINNVLNLTRIETGRVEYQIRPVLVTSVLADLSSLVQPQFAAREISLTTRLLEGESDAPLYVAVDREKLIQILTNLLGNAAKFTPPGGRVELALVPSPDPEMATIEVHDSGPGIPAEMLEAIFEPFVQLDRSLTTPAEGTGLGLAISRDLARGMHGELRAESTPGDGATLILTLPRAALRDLGEGSR